MALLSDIVFWVVVVVIVGAVAGVVWGYIPYQVKEFLKKRFKPK